MGKVQGRVRKFGDNVDTDTITPGSLLHLSLEELKDHAFEPISPGFARTVREGDIIVGGNNFLIYLYADIWYLFQQMLYISTVNHILHSFC